MTGAPAGQGGARRPAGDPGRRVALVRLSSLGDVVHGLPVAHALRAAWPDAELTWVVERGLAPILARNPDLDHVVPVDTRGWRAATWRGTGARAAAREGLLVARRLRAGRFDVALDLQGLWKSGLVAWLTRAPVRVGFAARDCRERGSAWFTNRRVPFEPASGHVVTATLGLLRAVGLDPARLGEPVFPLPVDPDAARAVARLLEEEGLKPDAALVLLNPGSGGKGKRWAVEAYRRLGDELAVRLSARVLVAWGPGEEPLARAIAHGMRTTALVPPATALPEMAALLARASLVVGGDTGPIHVAAALGVPTVGLYGPTSPTRNGPLGPRALAVASPTGRMADIGVGAVVEAAEALWR